jgi:hypothetical protein
MKNLLTYILIIIHKNHLSSDFHKKSNRKEYYFSLFNRSMTESLKVLTNKGLI